MKSHVILGAAAAASLLGATGAQAITVICTPDRSPLQEVVRLVPPHTTVKIKGNCVGNIAISTDDLSFVADSDGSSITGQVEVTSQRVSFSRIDISGPEPSDGTPIRGGIFAHDGASVRYENGTIANHIANGILATRNASVAVVNSHILGNGTGSTGVLADGVRTADGGSITLGDLDASNVANPAAGVEVANSRGVGVSASRTGSVFLLAGSVHDNGTQAVLATVNGSIVISGTTISAPAPAAGPGFDAVVANLGGSIDIEDPSNSPAGRTTVSSHNGGVLAVDSGVVRIRGATVTSLGGADGAVGSFRSSSLRLEGDTVITGSNGDPALLVGDGASIRIDNGTPTFSAASNQLQGALGVFDAGVLRIDDPGATIAGSTTVSGNSLLVLNTATITGNIILARPSTLNAFGGPVNFTGNILCQNGGTQFVVGTPNPFNPPVTACTPF